jgi:hypothetical protein
MIACVALALIPCIPCALCACESGRAPPPSPSAVPTGPIVRVAQLLHVDAADLEPSVDPPAPPGDLKAEIDQFTTVDACVQQRARVDPLLGDALEAIGYDTFLRDACRVLDAVKARDDKRCEAIDASLLRERCAVTFAEIMGDADACPWQISTRPDRGRDTACVAIALREPRLCTAVEARPMAAICEAITEHDPAPCNELSSRSEQTRCARAAQRWYNAIPAADATVPLLPTATGKLHVTGADGGAWIESDLTADVARGVVLLQQRDGTRLVIGPLSAAGPGFIAPSPHVRATLALELMVPLHLPSREKDGTSTAPGGPHQAERPLAEGRIERIELLLPGHTPLATPAVRSTLIARIDKFEPVRGGEVKLSISGELDGEGASRRVQADLTTFVRDIVKASAVYGVKPPRLGADGGMR